MRHVLLVLILCGTAFADEEPCPPKAGDPCFREQRDACGLGVKDARTPQDLADRLQKCRAIQSGKAAAEQCKKSHDDPCWMHEEALCRDEKDANPPPWSTPESRAKKREDARRKLEACRKAPPPKKDGALPPWRKP